MRTEVVTRYGSPDVVSVGEAARPVPATDEVLVRVHATTEHAFLEVEDTGPGIAPAERERVFERFYRIPNRNSHDASRSGIGLGLPIARRLVEAQGGRIWIADPASGRGTTVAMLLPLAMETYEVEQPVAVAR